MLDSVLRTCGTKFVLIFFLNGCVVPGVGVSSGGVFKVWSKAGPLPNLFTADTLTWYLVSGVRSAFGTTSNMVKQIKIVIKQHTEKILSIIWEYEPSKSL